MKRLLLIGVVTSVLSGCAGMFSPLPPKLIDVQTPFDAVEAKKMAEQGDNTLLGSAFLRQRGGGVVTCAGREVKLIPMTGYAKERLQYFYGSLSETASVGTSSERVIFAPDEIEYYSTIKTTICDASGKFKFNNVAKGRFFVTTTVVWEAPVYNYILDSRQMSTQGGALGQAVTLTGKEVKEIILSK